MAPITTLKSSSYQDTRCRICTVAESGRGDREYQQYALKVLNMKTLIVYASVHHQNTEKVAKVKAAELGADLVPISQAQPSTLAEYDLIGFGSGIYGGNFHKTLLQFVAAPTCLRKTGFVFSTCGMTGTLKVELGIHTRYDCYKEQKNSES
jgi:flavodoxin